MLNNETFLGNRYEIIEKIGSGGMSDVYRAKDHSLGRDVAIKVLKPEFAEDSSFVTRFRTEAQAAASLEHPNIVNIYDVGSEDGLYYIVMEYVDGITLKRYIATKGRLGYNEALSIAIQMARGLEAAHNHGIVHQDIKPQNIIISKEGKVKVTDFGIARAANSNTIRAGSMGSVHYVSPEQARNGYVSYASDIYSMGIVMYEMVTGRVPFDGDTPVAIAIQHIQSQMTPPEDLVPGLPIAISRIIEKCTMKSPERRYASASELLVDLKKAMVNPNEDFVVIPQPGASDFDKTRVISNDEQEEIKKHSFFKNDDDESDRVPDTDKDDKDDDDSPVNSRMDKAITIMGIAAAIVIVAIIIFFVGSVFNVFHFGSSKKKAKTTTEKTTVVVPDLKGYSIAQAKTALKAKGLKFAKAGEESSDTVDKDDIIRTDPKSGKKVEPGTTVSVYVSTGKGNIDVPSVVGKDQGEATSILKDAGFDVETKTVYSDSVASGKVISQTPDSSDKDAKEGDTVTITVSRGVETVQVPYVKEKAQSDAQNAITSAGLAVGNVTQQPDSTIAKGKVISSDPAGGSKVSKGTRVNLVVSTGPQLYSFSQKISPMDTDNYDENFVVLKDSNGKQLKTWTIGEETTVSVTDITTQNGTLEYYVDSSMADKLGSSAVTFTAQQSQ
ncbi:MAG: Stk1 family PASTA domain-containing Ser/Thr kinase [Lachnospiraceae bacterium]|uniref:non-specific serine/threonine protein kinase n=1 Tax=Candidatus Weimeria bifida TaxID=2599074 RepID=A0A6N7J0S9_9FIRM|nr:Stk1 family PASTA domain-containing Ser/Thr kinase [Candidatus Weimeria bifida]RRF96665.1 MAG: Stk1 family PASTA domain-containing Ser/Thr kinase [Lachnospiraceae bacterium]